MSLLWRNFIPSIALLETKTPQGPSISIPFICFAKFLKNNLSELILLGLFFWLRDVLTFRLSHTLRFSFFETLGFCLAAKENFGFLAFCRCTYESMKCLLPSKLKMSCFLMDQEYYYVDNIARNRAQYFSLKLKIIIVLNSRDLTMLLIVSLHFSTPW